MNGSSSLNRREFFRTTVIAGAGVAAFGQVAMAAVPASGLSGAWGLVDTNVSLGRWPSRRLPFDETSALVAKLRREGVTQAWAGNLDAAFGKDLRAANAWLARECQKRGRDVLVPFGTINPALADWPDELQRCHEQYRMPGLRLYPNYHGYALGDPVVAKLLASVAERGLIVQIAMSLEDDRTQPPAARVAQVEVKPLLALLKKPSLPRLILLNWYRGIKLETVKALAEMGVGFDIATVENVGGVANLVGEISAGRVLFGSHAPFFYLESALLKLKESAFASDSVRAICQESAQRLLGRTIK